MAVSGEQSIRNLRRTGTLSTHCRNGTLGECISSAGLCTWRQGAAPYWCRRALQEGMVWRKVSVPEVAAQLGARVEFDNHGAFVKHVYSRFGSPRPPHVPDDLRPWVEMDPDLRTMARDRIEGHLLENHVTLEFKERMGAGGEVAATVAGRGLTAGGTYEALYHSVWHFEVEYWRLDDIRSSSSEGSV